jgi:LPS-assembly lipoprotein
MWSSEDRGGFQAAPINELPDRTARDRTCRRATGTASRFLRRLSLALALCTMLVACGFQLRGVADFPFNTLYIDAPAASPFANQLRRVVGTGTRTRVTNTPAEADATLQLIYELREREILSLSPEGRAREFQLRYRVAYQVLDRGKQVITPRTEIVLRRDYTFGDQEHLAREAEEVLLYRDMEHDAVHQLVRRLQARARS